MDLWVKQVVLVIYNHSTPSIAGARHAPIGIRIYMAADYSLAVARHCWSLSKIVATVLPGKGQLVRFGTAAPLGRAGVVGEQDCVASHICATRGLVVPLTVQDGLTKIGHSHGAAWSVLCHPIEAVLELLLAPVALRVPAE